MNLDENTSESPIWKMHYREELNETFSSPPINGFDEMITLTSDGKLWTFPIDNEQGSKYLKNFSTVYFLNF